MDENSRVHVVAKWVRVQKVQKKKFSKPLGRIERTTSTKVAGSDHSCEDEITHLVPIAPATLGDYRCSRYILSTG